MGFFIGAGVVLTQGDKYVLVREVRHEKAGLYNLPAGTLEVGESLITCAVREAEEETGVNIELDGFLGVYQAVIGADSNVVFLVFTSKVAADAMFTSDEHDEVASHTYQEIVDLDKANKLRSPIVLKSIQDHRSGKILPLEHVQSWYIENLSSITVKRDH